LRKKYVILCLILGDEQSKMNLQRTTQRWRHSIGEMLMDEREALRIAIERARIRLDEALERAKSMDECYDLSLEVDRLIENYVSLCEQKELVPIR